MIVDKTYFTGMLNIPNLDFSDSTTLLSNNDNLDRVIAKSSFKYLTDVFGYSIAKEILNVIEPDGSISPGADQKYIDLINGNDVQEWLGLRYEINGVKYSQIANFAYCQYLYEYQNRLTDFGLTSDQAEKGTVISSWSKYNDAWRDMFAWRQPEWLIPDIYDMRCTFHENDIKTLYEYIQENENWNTDKFVYYQNTNALGL